MKSSLAVCSLLMLALAACKPSEPPPHPDTATGATAPADPSPETPVMPPPDTTMAVSGVQPPSAFDSKALIGRFAGTLTCDSCPGTHLALDVRADGTFLLEEAAADGSLAAPTVTNGTWAMEDTDATQLLRLDPDSKEAADRVFAIEASNLLRVRNADGTTLAGDDAVLTRQ